MANEGEYRAGRAPVPVTPDRDYSGRSFMRQYADDEGLERSLFNGVNITDCAFHGISLQNCEFTEALIQQSRFSDCDISGSDFVLAKIEDTAFVRCKFESGEWRDSRFVNCEFIECDFDHATTTLCYFDGCRFDGTTAASLDHRAVYHNVYSLCSFGGIAMTKVVSSKNFGLPAANEDLRDLVKAGSGLSLDGLCLLNNLGRYRNIFLADVAASLALSEPRVHQIRAGTITFVARIVRALAREGRISTTSLIFVEAQLAAIANAVNDPTLFIAVMSAVIEVRTAILSLANEAVSIASDEGDVQNLTIRFEGNFGDQHATALREALEQGAGISGGLSITEIRRGSTTIEMVAVATLGLSTVMTSVNYVLRQAAVTIERVAAIKRAVRKLNPPPRARASKARHLVPIKAASVLDVALMPSEVAQLKEVVRRHGRLLVEMDEAASIRILVQ